MLRKLPYRGRMVLPLLLLLLQYAVAGAVTPSEAFENGRKKIASAKTVSASFTMKADGQKVSGTLQSKGSKFVINSNATANWYNGTDLYTYVPSKNETTVFKPSQSELAEVNPLLYLNSAGNYKIAGSKTKKAGLETVVLIPKQTGSGMKNITIELDSKTYLPKNIKLATSSGSVIELTLSNVKLNGTIDDSVFNYPKTKYPKAKIIDMR